MSGRFLQVFLLCALSLCVCASTCKAADEDKTELGPFVDSNALKVPPAKNIDATEERLPPVEDAGEDADAYAAAAEDEMTEPAAADKPEPEVFEADDKTAAAGATDEKADEKKKEAEKEEPEVIPPAPEPTCEQIQTRHVKARDYRSLAEKALRFPVTGTLYTRYRARFDTRDEHSQDIYNYLTIDVGDKARQWATGHADMRVAADLDNSGTGVRSDIFASILDTYDNDINYRLYSAYVDFNKIPGIETLRAGRQWQYDTPEVLQMDGLRLDTQPICGRHDLQFSFYGGVPVHLDESSAEGDWLAGLAVQAKPWETARLRLDYTHITDDQSGRVHNTPDLVQQSFNQPDGTVDNNLVALSMWQTFHNPDIRLFGRVETLDADAREAEARCIYYRKQWDLQMALTYRVVFERENHLVTELDPFTPTLQGQEPYHNLNFVFTKQWAQHYRIEGGAMVRRLAAGGDEGQFNHDFDRFYLTFGVNDLPIQGLSASATGYWYEGRDGPSIGTAGAEISYNWNKKLITTGGTDFELYTYDVFLGTERESVRTYYFKQRWRPERWAVLDVEYNFEQSLTREFHTVIATFRFNF
jgi:hypothetical protein